MNSLNKNFPLTILPPVGSSEEITQLREHFGTYADTIKEIREKIHSVLCGKQITHEQAQDAYNAALLDEYNTMNPQLVNVLADTFQTVPVNTFRRYLSFDFPEHTEVIKKTIAKIFENLSGVFYNKQVQYNINANQLIEAIFSDRGKIDLYLADTFMFTKSIERVELKGIPFGNRIDSFRGILQSIKARELYIIHMDFSD